MDFLSIYLCLSSRMKSPCEVLCLPLVRLRVLNQVICQACSCLGDLRSLSCSPALSSCLQNNPKSQPRPVSQLRLIQFRSEGTFEGVWSNPTKVRSCSVRTGCSVPCWGSFDYSRTQIALSTFDCPVEHFSTFVVQNCPYGR